MRPFRVHNVASSAGRPRRDGSPDLNVGATLVPQYTSRPRELPSFKHTTENTAHLTNTHNTLTNGPDHTTHHN